MSGDIKKRLREYALGMQVDDIGFARVDAYRCNKGQQPGEIYPEARSIIVMAYNELTWIESPVKEVAMNGRLDLMSFQRSCNYRMMKFLKKEFNAGSVSTPFSYPMQISPETMMGLIGVFSLRHAALAAGLGVFGRHNLIIHPEFGSRVVFSALLTDIEIEPDRVLSGDLCNQCGVCVEGCPADALETEGKTDMMKCLKNSQPYGMGGAVGFWQRFAAGDKEEQKKMLRGTEFFRLYQAQVVGFQYFCFECIKNCPAGNFS